jgi:hypothetical protein
MMMLVVLVGLLLVLAATLLAAYSSCSYLKISLVLALALMVMEETMQPAVRRCWLSRSG